MNPIDIVILVAVVGALAAIVGRAVVKHRRAKLVPAAGCGGCEGCSARAGCSAATTGKTASCCH